MAKSNQKIKARKLRKNGISVNQIAKKVGISKSTASYWVRDIILSVEQLEKLRNNSIQGSERGRLKGAFIQKQKRIAKELKSYADGKSKIRKLSNREMLLIGIALYWAEGAKKTREVQLCNSDPRMINYFINWLISHFGVEPKDIRLIVGINQIHQDRENEVLKYWSEITNFPLAQFRKISYKKTQNKKTYENKSQHFGTLSVKVLKPARYYYKIMGLIQALSNMPA